jgi:hypothetical protein
LAGRTQREDKGTTIKKEDKDNWQWRGQWQHEEDLNVGKGQSNYKGGWDEDKGRWQGQSDI